MLKLTYIENNFKLEYLNESLETWVNTRVILALQTAQHIHLISGTASFLITSNPYLMKLEKADHRIEICPCDAEFVEVTLKGLWLTSNAGSETGVFVTVLSESVEFLLHELSQSQQFCQV
ncbi:alr0857 family protein [Iningainema tapete]|uniref:Uncharacterized protein n=1 Tax=Iningainema tapete BLCC-T55 TaxID=2748662 RepID=A0A8J6XKM5_9CYAN|nr:alr0857 family protein [Iningainema tapete]MBD2774371.1 hypothetical protein [Iningainema tapete BLCC-T55]